MTIEQTIEDMYCPECDVQNDIKYNHTKVEKYFGIKLNYDYYQCPSCKAVKEKYDFKLYTLKKFIKNNGDLIK